MGDVRIICTRLQQVINKGDGEVLVNIDSLAIMLAGTTLHKSDLINTIANPSMELVILIEFTVDATEHKWKQNPPPFRFTSCLLDGEWFLVSEKKSTKHTKYIHYILEDKIPKDVTGYLQTNAKLFVDNIELVNTKLTKYL